MSGEGEVGGGVALFSALKTQFALSTLRPPAHCAMAGGGGSVS